MTTNPDQGIVVDNTESGVRYAITARNLDPKAEVYVRDLRSDETVRGYHPRVVQRAEATPVEDVADTDEDFTIFNDEPIKPQKKGK